MCVLVLNRCRCRNRYYIKNKSTYCLWTYRSKSIPDKLSPDKQTHTHAHTSIHTHTHTQKFTLAHTCARARTHTHTHTHTTHTGTYRQLQIVDGCGPVLMVERQGLPWQLLRLHKQLFAFVTVVDFFAPSRLIHLSWGSKGSNPTRTRSVASPSPSYAVEITTEIARHFVFKCD